VLHVSAYDEYDLIPAARLGMRTIGVSRDGAPNRPSATVDAMIGSLAELPPILAGIRG
jgi:FMN phosphatase YigB (HAD superfamily)